MLEAIEKLKASERKNNFDIQFCNQLNFLNKCKEKKKHLQGTVSKEKYFPCIILQKHFWNIRPRKKKEIKGQSELIEERKQGMESIHPTEDRNIKYDDEPQNERTYKAVSVHWRRKLRRGRNTKLLPHFSMRKIKLKDIL